MNRLGQARDALVTAAAPVLSGRVYPYPPTPQQAQVAPAVWVGQCDGFRTTIGESTQIMVAVFPIQVVYDGADRAQVAGIDDIVSGLVDAVAGVKGAEIRGWRTEVVNPDLNRRATVLEVEYTITARTLCLPDVGGDVVHATADVVEGARDVTWHATILAVTPPAAVSTPPAGGDPITPPDQVPTP